MPSTGGHASGTIFAFSVGTFLCIASGKSVPRKMVHPTQRDKAMAFLAFVVAVTAPGLILLTRTHRQVRAATTTTTTLELCAKDGSLRTKDARGPQSLRRYEAGRQGWQAGP